ncbi:MAG: polysaccharide deacetylase family protein [Nitrospira sp.]
MGTVQTISRVKALARRMAAELYAHTPGFLSGLKGKVVILTYHRVVTDREIVDQSIQPGMYVTQEVFAAQMRFLTKHFTTLSFREILALWDEGRWDAGARYCVVTFDDGWLDNYLHAFPILSALHIPATVFLPTGYIGTSDWFWPEKISWLARQSIRRPYAERVHVQTELKQRLGLTWAEHASEDHDGIDALIESCKRQPQEWITALTESWTDLLGERWPTDRLLVTWDEVRDMSAAGIDFGSHSVSHRLLPSLSKDEIRQEAVESWEALVRQSVRTVPVFCYPNGDWSVEVEGCVQAAGYRAATTTRFGYESAKPANRFELKRVNIHQDVTWTDSLFAFHLAGFNQRGRA